MKSPDFDDVVGTEVDPAERERLRRVHDLLIAVGPPPELPVAFATRRRTRAQRRMLLLLAAAIAVGAAAFGAGWFARGGESFAVRMAVPMHATTDAPGAWGLIKLGYPDSRGNWQMLVTVAGLKPLPKDGYYNLELTIHGKPVATCGTFKVSNTGETTVKLGASYNLQAFDGWVVQPWYRPGHKLNRRILLTT
jgi:hypothetical protein